MQSRRFGLTAPGLIKLRDLAIELLELVKTNMPKKSGGKNAWKFEKAHSLLHKVGYRMQYRIYFIKDNKISHTISFMISFSGLTNRRADCRLVKLSHYDVKCREGAPMRLQQLLPSKNV